jgi:putative hemolysin
LVESYQHSASTPGEDDAYEPYKQSRLSYSTSFTNPWKASAIRTVEWLTGKITLLNLIRKYERQGSRAGQLFWGDCLRVMGIDLTTPKEQFDNIPKEGPLVVVSNHPHGLVDGMILAELVGRVRTDYKVLTRALLTDVPQIEQFMIAVAFPHEADAQRLNVEMRKKCMEHLATGGAVVLFPAGSVACSDTYFGPAIEPEWNPFTAKMIRRSGATVVPIKFPGQNSRFYQIANKISATVRQGLLLHEVKVVLNKPQAPIIGRPITTEEMAPYASNQTTLMAWLREKSLNL